MVWYKSISVQLLDQLDGDDKSNGGYGRRGGCSDRCFGFDVAVIIQLEKERIFAGVCVVITMNTPQISKLNGRE